MKTKILAALLVACMILSLASIAMAATTVSDGAAFKTAVEAGESVVLSGDITLNESLTVKGKTLQIDLNGNTLALADGDNFFQSNSDITILNGTVDISNGVASGDAYINVGNYSNSATLTLKDVTFKGEDYSSAYAVFYVRQNSTLNIDNCTIDLKNDNASAGGVFKGKYPHSINITNGSVLNFTDADIGILGGNVLIKDSELNIKGGTNAINSAAGDNELHLTLDNAQLNLKDGVGGTGMKLRGGSTLVVKNNSSLSISGYTDSGEYDLLLDNSGSSISIDNSSYVAFNTLSVPSDVLDKVIDSDILDHLGDSAGDHVLAVGATVTYTDGLANENVFADEVYTVYGGQDTPAFAGSTTRDGYTFAGWTPALKEKVDGDITYTATWEENAPAPATPTPAPAAPVVTAAPAAPAPKTGDNTNIALWMSLMLISGVALLGLRKKASK